MTPEAYLDALLTLPGLYTAKVSPDGRWVAWSWFRAGPAADVYAAPTDGSQPPIRLTDTLDNTYLIDWTPDGRGVLVEQDKDGNERSRIFRIDLDKPLVMTPLTEDDPPFFLRGGELTPDGKVLVFGANYNVATGEEIESTWLYRHDLETGERVAIARPEKPTWLVPQMNRQGTQMLYMRKDRHPSGEHMWLVNLDGSNDHEIFNFGDQVKTFATWLPDGKRLLVTTETPTHKKIGMYDIASRETRWLLDDPSRNIEHAFVPRPAIEYGETRVVVIEITEAQSRRTLLDIETGEETLIPAFSGNLRLVAPVSANGDWIAIYYSSTQPTDVMRFNLPAFIENPDPAQFISISRIWERTTLTSNDLTAAEDYRWKSVDGLDIQGWLYRTKTEQPKGTVIYVHGGPTSHSQDVINNEIQFFVRSGFNVLDPNYRGSTGFSMSFREAIKEDGWGGREQDDIRTGIESLIAAGIAQPGKVGMTGTSYGGYSSWCGITRFSPDVLAASAPVCGMTDLVVDYQTTRPDLRPYSEEMLGGSPDQVPQRYYDRSPINFVNNIKGRLLIVQGMQDPNVTPDNVREVSKALQDAGVEFGVLAFEDEGHGISRPKNQKTLYQKLEAFFSEAFEVSST